MELTARKNAIQLALQERESSESKPTLNIQFRGQTRQLPVVVIGPAVPLLNHDNYRFAAQLEDHPHREALLSDPGSKESQDFLASLLSGSEEFKKLKAQINQLGQREPGLITRDGVLVNGNTRTVAIRELGLPGLRVAVLPEDTTSEDVLNLQVELQMVRLVHNDYTFTNELLLIDKLLSLQAADEKTVIKKLGWPAGKSSQPPAALLWSVKQSIRFPLCFHRQTSQSLR